VKLERIKMASYICVTCGNQYAATEQLPLHCPICEDERQYVNPDGQAWTTLEELRRDHHNIIRSLEPGLTEIATAPKFAIGQRALLVQTSKGNVLWDSVSLIDDATIAAIEAMGGISALAMSHPHMFASMVEWSHAFGKAPIYLHGDFRQWVQRPDPVVEFWEGDARALDEGVTLHRCGGHFTGSTVLLWPDGAQGRGVLLSSDTLHVTPDRRHVSFMYSYPNYIPLNAATVDAIVARVMALKFDRMYSHFFNLVIEAEAKSAVQRSAARYKQAIVSQNQSRKG
jgi:glyoxylase-like metal-dependent hydrolase (beta-lactamase superfamily II)